MACIMCPPDLVMLQEKINSCKLCPLSFTRNHAVPGSGPSKAEIMLIGEAPGREEDLKGLPFTGRAGRVLDEALEKAGLSRSDLFITSVVKCRPPNNRNPRREEIELCLPYLKDQMEAINPRIICLMGNIAARAVLGVVGVSALRNQTLSDRFLVTYHPAAVLRNKNLMEDFVSDLRRARMMSLKVAGEGKDEGKDECKGQDLLS